MINLMKTLLGVKTLWKNFIAQFKRQYKNYTLINRLDRKDHKQDYNKYISQFREDVNATFLKEVKDKNISSNDDEYENTLFKVMSDKIVNYNETTVKYKYHIGYPERKPMSFNDKFKKFSFKVKGFFYGIKKAYSIEIAEPYKKYIEKKKILGKIY